MLELVAVVMAAMAFALLIALIAFTLALKGYNAKDVADWLLAEDNEGQ